MKKWIVSILVITLLVVATTPAFAQGKPPDKPGNGHGNGYGLTKEKTPDVITGKGQPANKAAHQNGKMPGGSNFVLFGTVVAVGTGTIDVDVLMGNNLVQVFLGKQAVEDENETEDPTAPQVEGKLLKGILVPEGTRIKIFDGATVKWGTLADVKAGMVVRVHGWWQPAEDATFDKKPAMTDLESGVWTARQVFELNGTVEETED